MKKWAVITAGILLVIGLAFSTRHILAGNNEEALSKQEAIRWVQTTYSGEVKNIVNQDHGYNIKMETSSGIYTLQLNKETGSVSGLNLVKKSGSNETRRDGNTEKSSPKLSKQEAKQIALKKVGKGTVTDIALDAENDLPVYSIKIQYNSGEAKLEINGNTGEIELYTSQNKRDTDTPSPNRDRPPETKISGEQAKQIALAKINGSVDEVQLMSWNGSYAYEIEIQTDETDTTVYVQAYTGEILNYTFEKEEADDEDDDDQDNGEEDSDQDELETED